MFQNKLPYMTIDFKHTRNNAEKISEIRESRSLTLFYLKNADGKYIKIHQWDIFLKENYIVWFCL